MTRRPLQNVAASVHQRLLNVAKATSRPFGEVLQYFAMERFLYRLCQSTYADAFVLKGALLFRVWDVPDSRATRDIDFLAYMDPMRSKGRWRRAYNGGHQHCDPSTWQSRA